MHEDQAANGFSALGNCTRLRLYRLLVKAGDVGLNAGDIQARIRVPASTLAHHLVTLTRAGLVVQERRGREVISRADYDAVESLVDYLTRECCAGVDVEDGSNAA